MDRRICSVAALVTCALLLLALDAPSQTPGLHPVPFRSADGSASGWKITIPGRRPLATPAVAEGKIFIGGGFGSHEFYAFDAASGNLLWTYHTADDGPTAAVVRDGKIVFNTESCELETLTTGGKRLWKKWLGDPLMSMPAVADGKIYMAYPKSRSDRRYYLAAFDFENGAELWKHPIGGEVITAPVIGGDRVYAATVDGSLVSLNRRDGALLWEEKKNATSSPAVWEGQCYFSRREAAKLAAGVQQNEMVAVRRIVPSAPVEDIAATRRPADYLDYSKRFKSAAEARSQALDAAVGFAGPAKGSADMLVSRANLGQASVHGIWAYQGSKPFVSKGRLYSSMGDTVLSVDPKTEKIIWRRSIYDNAPALDAALSPPAIVNGKLFVGTRRGDIVALSQRTGDVLWKVNVGEPVVFQPAVAAGRLYVSTESGSIVCLSTRDSHDDGWLMWGGNAAHNGLADR